MALRKHDKKVVSECKLLIELLISYERHSCADSSTLHWDENNYICSCNKNIGIQCCDKILDNPMLHNRLLGAANLVQKNLIIKQLEKTKFATLTNSLPKAKRKEWEEF